MIGIFAYGSLIPDPGWELKDLTERMIEGLETPFPVEYARHSSTRADAPTLVPVPDGIGTPVQASVFVLKPRTRLQRAKDVLYRREIHQVGNHKKRYVYSDHPGRNTTILNELHKFQGIDSVIYTSLEVNLPNILDVNQTEQNKADYLAQLAIDSINERTFFTCQDGIHYLASAIHYGVITKLTEPYRRAILRLTNDSRNLFEARLWIAKRNGIIDHD